MKEFIPGNIQRRPIERWTSTAIVAVAMLLGLLVPCCTGHHPHTDDAEILANFIGMAPQVEGPIVEFNVHDNQFVKRGDLLFIIDLRP